MDIGSQLLLFLAAGAKPEKGSGSNTHKIWMGLCSSAPETAESKQSRQVEASLREQYNHESEKIKLLLLGTGGK